MIRPRAPLFLVFLPAIAIAAYLAVIYELGLLYAALSILGTMLVLSLVLAWMGLRGLSASRRHEPEVLAGVPFDVEIAIENRTPALSSMLFTVEDQLQREHESRPASAVVVTLEPGEQARLGYRARVRRRGEYALASVHLSSRFPFGAFEKRATLRAPSRLLVLPRPGRLTRDLLAEHAALFAERPVAVRGGLGEFHSVRPFQPGDNPRWVHWATSARTGSLWVREFEREIERRLAIVFDAAPQAHFERAVTMCATLADHYLRRGWRVAFALLHEKPAWVAFGAGPDHLRRVLRALAPVAPCEGDRRTAFRPTDLAEALVAVVGRAVPAALSGARTVAVDPSDPALREAPDEIV